MARLVFRGPTVRTAAKIRAGAAKAQVAATFWSDVVTVCYNGARRIGPRPRQALKTAARARIALSMVGSFGIFVAIREAR